MEPEPVIREGFLSKKAHKKHRWKTRWFKLHEDRLLYCKKKDRSTPIGKIKLPGCSISYPVPGYEKRQGIFQVCTTKGKQHLLQASTDVAREEWCHAITAVLRSKGTKRSRIGSLKRRLSTKLDLSEVLGAMQDQDAGVPLETHKADGVEHVGCFTGKQVISWLQHWSFVMDREEGIKLSQMLLKLAHIIPIHVKPTTMGDMSPGAVKMTFVDSDDAVYRFSSLTLSPSVHDSIFENSSSESSSDSSEGEQSEEEKPKSNKIKGGRTVREGFLLKRGYLRKQWKSRRVILRESPATIEYYSISKFDNEPLKVINLDGANVVDINTSQHQNMEEVSKKKQCVFCVQLADSRTLVFQAEDERSKKQWMAAITRLCSL